MLAYAVRFKVDEIILFYPDTIKGNQDNLTEIVINDTLADNRQINIKAFQLPIINRLLLEDEININSNLKELFDSTRINLKGKIEGILEIKSIQ
jgi:5-methylcytosine-specific restriction enzyme subunit McrC